MPGKIPYTHPPLRLQEQIALLKQKGLHIPDEELAQHWLSHVSYFRLKNYSYSFKDYSHNNGDYLPGTTFDMILQLYLFDRKLKMLLFEALESIEVAIKTTFSNIMSLAHGAHWYTQSHHFIGEEEKRNIIRHIRSWEEIPKGFNHALFLKNIERELESPAELFLQAYKNTYTPAHPPSWMMMELITFGTCSVMYENLRPSVEKNAISESFQLTKKQLVSWLHSFSFIRNKCAHHARLVYAKINFAPAMPQKRNRQFLAAADEVDNSTLYAVFCCLQYMLRMCNRQAPFRDKLLDLTEAFTSIQYDRLGFTSSWRNEALWAA